MTGFFQRPDYLYMLENEDDSYKNISTFFLSICLRETLQNWKRRAASIWSDIMGNNDTDFRRAVNEKYHMHSYSSGRRKSADCDGTLTGGNVSDHVVDAPVHPASSGSGADLYHYQQKGKDRTADDRNALCHGVHQSAVSPSLCRICSHSRHYAAAS